MTNKQSNILEDLDTLRLLSKIVPEFAMSYDEDDILKYAFELVAAFDEVISLGYKENISVMQVKQNCEMESHEEKLHKMIIQVHPSTLCSPLTMRTPNLLLKLLFCRAKSMTPRTL
jgi:hypothetical protein